MRVMIVIPARMDSTRFPGKPLVDLMGKPMVQWVFEAARKSAYAEEVVVATPDPVIVDRCQEFGCKALLTRSDHLTGTDRIAEVASQVESEIYVNVQGDEPLIPTASIDACVAPLLEHADAQMASVYCDCEPAEIDNPMVVKVVTDNSGRALYFSRHAIPYPRNPRTIPVKKHVGLYAFRRQALLEFASLPPSPLEIAESLEQLRFLENGIGIQMSPAQGTELAVDTPEQAEQVRRILELRSSSRV